MRGKVVLITGASTGIGAGTAVHLAAKGCLLALTGRKLSGLQDTLKDCLRAGAKEDDVLLIQADLLVFDNLAMIVEKTVGKFGRLDVLVNNAAHHALGDLEKVTRDDYDTTMDTNVKSVVFLSQAALPHLLKSNGNVVNVSGISSHSSCKDATVIGMSKAALDHFTRTSALDVAAKGVRVNAVNPGGVKTPVIEKLGIPFEEVLAKMHAMGRCGTVEEIAKTIAFLADNEQSSFTTGVTSVVDGGALLMSSLRLDSL